MLSSLVVSQTFISGSSNPMEEIFGTGQGTLSQSKKRSICKKSLKDYQFFAFSSQVPSPSGSDSASFFLGSEISFRLGFLEEPA